MGRQCVDLRPLARSHTVRRHCRGGIFSEGTSGSPDAASEEIRRRAFGGDAFVPRHAAAPWLSFSPFCTTRSGAGKFACPAHGSSESSGRRGDQARIGPKSSSSRTSTMAESSRADETRDFSGEMC